MKATEIIRGVLDLIDQIDCPTAEPEITVAVPQEELPAENPMTVASDQNHFKQIFDLLSAEKEKLYSNSPAEVVAGIESVTTNAGGGLNGPKDPADIRSDSVAMYPDYAHKRDQ